MIAQPALEAACGHAAGAGLSAGNFVAVGVYFVRLEIVGRTRSTSLVWLE